MSQRLHSGCPQKLHLTCRGLNQCSSAGTTKNCTNATKTPQKSAAGGFELLQSCGDICLLPFAQSQIRKWFACKTCNINTLTINNLSRKLSFSTFEYVNQPCDNYIYQAVVDAGVKGEDDQGHHVDGKHVVGQGSKSAASLCKRMQPAMQLVSTS